MDELDVLEALAERGELRGAALVWQAAVAQLGAPQHGAAADDLLPEDLPFALLTDPSAEQRRLPGPRRRRLLVAVTAASVLAVLGGLLAVRQERHRGLGSATPGPDATSTSAPPPANSIDGPLGRLVVNALPNGFAVVSTAKAAGDVVLAVGPGGRVIAVTYGRDRAGEQSDLTRAATGRDLVAGVADGTLADAVVVTEFGDAIGVQCLFGDAPCSGVTGEPTFDVRPIAEAVAGGITATNREAFGRFAALTDGARSADAEAVLDRIEQGGLNPSSQAPSYERSASGGWAPFRAWRRIADPALSVSVRALPLGVATAQSPSSGPASSAVTIAAEGWLFVATALNASGGDAPFTVDELRRVVSFGLGALAPVPATGDLAGSGRLVLDPPPAGWYAMPSLDGRDLYSRERTTRVYADASSRPERNVAVALTASSVFGGVPVTNDPTAVEVAGTRAQLIDLGSGHLRLLFGPVGGRWATLDGYGLDRASVVAMGASVTPAADGESLVLPPSALPSGLVERAVGHDDGVRFVPAGAENSPIPVAYWTDGNVFLRYLSYRAPADTLAVYRLGASEVIDTTIGGRSVFIATLGGRRYAGWAEGDRLYVVESANADDATPIPIDLFVDYLGRLRPATAAEWSAMQAPATTPNGSPVTTTSIFRATG